MTNKGTNTELDFLISDLEYLTDSQYSLKIYVQAPARKVWKGYDYWEYPDPIGIDLEPLITEKIREMCIKHIKEKIKGVRDD